MLKEILKDEMTVSALRIWSPLDRHVHITFMYTFMLAEC